MTRGLRVPEPFAAACFLYDRATQSVLLHQRDGNTTVNPNKWAFFGGHCEPGETDVACCLRELKEEIGLSLRPRDLKRLRRYMNSELGQYRVVFYVEKRVELADLVLSEGAGFAWIELAKVETLDLSARARDDLRYFIERISR
jgi:8-oxo-dGTP pyrophosphatase MutT (NUDIX family)